MTPDETTCRVTEGMLQYATLLQHPPITTIEDLAIYAPRFLTAVCNVLETSKRNPDLTTIEAFCSVLIDAITEGHYRTEAKMPKPLATFTRI